MRIPAAMEVMKMNNERLMMHMSCRMMEGSIGEIVLDGVFVSTKYFDEDICSTDIRKQLKAVSDAEELHVRINSPGGDAMQGMAIKNQIMQHGAKKKICFIEGMCASAATLPMLACDEVHIFDGAEIMIHRPSSLGFGTADDLLKTANALNVLEDDVKRMYAEFSGNSEEDVWAWMNDEKWFNAEEAVERGFATDIIGGGDRIEMMQMSGHTIEMLAYRNHPLEANAEDADNIIDTEENRMTLDELQRDHPELHAEVKNLGMQEERARLMGIEDVSLEGFDDLVRNAKYGEEPMSVADFSRMMLTEAKKRGYGFQQDRAKETEMNANVSGGAAEDDPENRKDNDDEIVKQMAEEAKAAMIRKGYAR